MHERTVGEAPQEEEDRDERDRQDGLTDGQAARSGQGGVVGRLGLGGIGRGFDVGRLELRMDIGHGGLGGSADDGAMSHGGDGLIAHVGGRTGNPG